MTILWLTVLLAGAGDDAGRLSDAIDRRVAAVWTARGLNPSAPASDGAFLRRVSLDVRGTLPTPAEAEAFLDDRDPLKRQKFLDRALVSEESAEHLATYFTNLLVGRTGGTNRFNDRDALRRRLHDAFAKNEPWDALVRDLLSAQGPSSENGAVAFTTRFEGKPAEVAGAASRVFLGMQIQCAECHDHPYQDWSQRDFHGLAAFFARSRPRPILDPEKKRPIGVELRDLPRGEHSMERDGERTVVYPRYRDGRAPTAADAEKRGRRASFAEYVTSDPLFPRALVNRLWDHYLGRGFVDPVDDLNPKAQAWNAGLFDFLTRDFAASGFDLRRLIAGILGSRVYALSTRPSSNNVGDEGNFSRARPRALSAEEVFHALLRASGAEGAMRRVAAEADGQLRDRYLRRFVFLFANDEMEEQESFQGTIPQALLFLNGPLSNGAFRAAGAIARGERRPLGTARAIASQKGPPGAKVDQLFLTVLTRRPDPEEKAKFTAHLENAKDLRAACEDALWALLNSTEFLHK